MSETSGNPVDGKSGIGETITTALRQPSFLRVMLLLAALVVVFVGMRLAAPILDPILFAVVLALLFSPIYAWVRRRGVPTPLALVIMLVGLTLLFLGIGGITGHLHRQVQRGDRVLHREAERSAGQHPEPDQEPWGFAEPTCTKRSVPAPSQGLSAPSSPASPTS